jgi:hypothetical protein
MANNNIGLLDLLKSCHEVPQAEAYKSGGKKTRNTISGVNSMIGRPGTRLAQIPTITSKIGKGI